MSAGRSSVGAFMSAAIAAGAERLFALPTYDRHDPVAGLLISAQCARVACVCVWVGGWVKQRLLQNGRGGQQFKAEAP
jgi:hypothetical protein